MTNCESILMTSLDSLNKEKFHDKFLQMEGEIQQDAIKELNLI